METLYIKKGRRYFPWGNEQSWHGEDIMRVGSFRLVYCPKEGHRRHTSYVTPDTASFLAAGAIAAYAMEEAMRARAVSTPQAPSQPWTEEQKRIIEKFKLEMAATGALIPEYWNQATAGEIAQAGIDAVIKVSEENEKLNFRSLCLKLLTVLMNCPVTSDAEWIAKRMEVLFEADQAIKATKINL
jgi:hypothetical protein